MNANTYGSSYGINANWTVWEGNVRKYRLESSKILQRQQALAGEDVVKTLKLGILQVLPQHNVCQGGGHNRRTDS